MTPPLRSPAKSEGDRGHWGDEGRPRDNPGWVLLLFLVLALFCRLLVVFRTVAPDRDTANYVAMARAFRAGDLASALAEVFPPLHPLAWALVGPIGGQSNEAWWFGGQILCVLLGTLSVGLLWRASTLFVTGPSTILVPMIASFWLAVGMLPAWNAADALSEGLFLVLLSSWLLAWAGRRDWLLSLLAGLCFLTRPEGGILFVPLLYRLVLSSPLLTGPARQWVLARQWVRSILVLAAGLVLPLLYLLAKARISGQFEILPVGSFMLDLSVFSEPGPGAALAAYFQRLLRFAGQGFDGLGYLAFPALFLSVVGLRNLDRDQRERIYPLILTAGIACLIVPLFKSNRRFWLTWLPILLPLAARPLSHLAWTAFRSRCQPGMHGAGLRWTRLRWTRLRWARLDGTTRLWLLILLFLSPHLIRLPRVRRPLLTADKQLAAHLVAIGAQRGQIAADLPRLLFFAEQAPLPPRHLSGAELMSLAVEDRTRYVVSLGPPKRDKLDRARLLALGYRPLDLEDILSAEQGKRGLVLYGRR